MHSKLAIKLSKIIFAEQLGKEQLEPNQIAQIIDDALEQYREAYSEDELDRPCPVVTHHRDPCVFCLANATKDFVQLSVT